MTTRTGRAIDDQGHPISETTGALVDAAGRCRGALPNSGADGRFPIAGPDLDQSLVFLAHPQFVRVLGPVPPNPQTETSYQMRKKSGQYRTQIKGASNTRVGFVEKDAKGLAAVLHFNTDGAGMMVVPKDSACTYRILPFIESGGALQRVSESLDLLPFPSLDALAADLRYKKFGVLRKSERETTYLVEPDIHLLFFFIPESYQDAVAWVPLIEEYDAVRETAFQGLHDNFCPTLRAGIKEGIGYASYRVPGMSIEEMVAKNGPLSDADCARLHQDVAAVLPVLAKRGLHHGNIAPKFVFTGPEGFRVAPPCPAVRVGSVFGRTQRLHDGLDGSDNLGLAATLFFAATGRALKSAKFESTRKPAVDALIKPLLS